MAVRSRQTIVLAILAVSILLGAGVLKALSRNYLPHSAFCLSRYYNLTPVAESVGDRRARSPQRWNQIEIRYGNYRNAHTRPISASGRHAEQLASASAIGARGSDCHFIICDGYSGYDGQIKTTKIWRDQSAGGHNGRKNSSRPRSTGRTIYICIATTNDSAATDFQIRRTEALVEELCRRFRIDRRGIRYPAG